nr:pyridoxal-phosphate dependent enzyme [Oryzicola mucosus]
METPRLVHLSTTLVGAAFPMMKLMPARYILDQAEKSGEVKPGAHIIETTSGTFGMALALLAAARGYKLTLVSALSLMDEKYRQRLAMLGADVIALEDEKGDGNQVGRLEQINRLRLTSSGSYWTRQYDSDGNWLSYARLAEQLVVAMGKIDCLVGCVGTGGSLCGTGTFLRSLYPDLRIVAVDTHRSVLFGHPVGKRVLRGLGNSVLPKNVRHELVDEIHWMGAYPAFRNCHRLYRKYGVFAGPTSGASALVGRWISKTNPGMRIAVIMPDEGHRHAETVFNETWLSALPNWTEKIASAPTKVSTIAPLDEGDWTFFNWSRRTLADVMRSQKED